MYTLTTAIVLSLERLPSLTYEHVMPGQQYDGEISENYRCKLGF